MSAVYLLVLLLASWFALVFQQFLPPIEWMHGARVNLVVVLIVFACMALDYPLLLAYLFGVGFVWDLLHVQVFIDGSGRNAEFYTEPRFGVMLLVFLVLGSMAHGLRPIFSAGRWEVFPPVVAIFCWVQLFAEYIFLTLARGSVAVGPEIWWRILGPGILAFVLAPPVCLAGHFLASWLRVPLQNPQHGYR